MTQDVFTIDEYRLAAALHDANVDCDFSREFDIKSCKPNDGPHTIQARAILHAYNAAAGSAQSGAVAPPLVPPAAAPSPDAGLWADVLKFVRWSANVRDDTPEAIAVARNLLARIEADAT